jgi:hypothetical protein
MATQLSSPVIYMPNQPSKLSASEVPEIKAALSPNNDELDANQASVSYTAYSMQQAS